MKNTTCNRMFLGAAVLALLLIVTSPVTTVWLIRREATKIVSDSLRGLTTSSLATMNVSEGFLQTALAVKNDGMAEPGDFIARIQETSRIVDDQYEGHRETLDGDAERRAFERMLEARRVYRAARQEVLDLLGAGRAKEAAEVFEGSCVRKFQAYAEALGVVVERNANEAKIRGEEIIRMCHWLMVIQLLLLFFFLIYGFFVPLTAVWERLTRRTVEIPVADPGTVRGE
jgi:hypothetical protein